MCDFSASATASSSVRARPAESLCSNSLPSSVCRPGRTRSSTVRSAVVCEAPIAASVLPQRRAGAPRGWRRRPAARRRCRDPGGSPRPHACRASRRRDGARHGTGRSPRRGRRRGGAGGRGPRVPPTRSRSRRSRPQGGGLPRATASRGRAAGGQARAGEAEERVGDQPLVAEPATERERLFHQCEPFRAFAALERKLGEGVQRAGRGALVVDLARLLEALGRELERRPAAVLRPRHRDPGELGTRRASACPSPAASSRLRVKCSSAAENSPRPRAAYPAANSAFARTGAGAASPSASASVSRSRPSAIRPRMLQNRTSAPARRKPSSTLPESIAHAKAARMLPLSSSSFASQARWFARASSGSADSDELEEPLGVPSLHRFRLPGARRAAQGRIRGSSRAARSAARRRSLRSGARGPCRRGRRACRGSHRRRAVSSPATAPALSSEVPPTKTPSRASVVFSAPSGGCSSSRSRREACAAAREGRSRRRSAARGATATATRAHAGSAA